MIILSILLTTLLIVAVYVIRNLLLKLEILEDALNNFQSTIQSTLDEMQEIDILGSFESDDEVGGTFHALKDLVQDLATFLGVEEDVTE